jgi:uncharacterized protein YggT (Ycf19 family)
MAFALLIAQTLVLVAGLALLAQFLVGIFSWRRRSENIVYRLFQVIASPVVKLVRWITPKVVLDRHIPLATFMLLLVAYFWLGFEHRDSCRTDLSQRGCDRWVKQWGGQPPPR